MSAWEAYPVWGGHYPVRCMDEQSARATAARLSSQIFPWKARAVGSGDQHRGEAASLVRVRDVFYNVIGRPENETDDVCETLGIDPELPVETVRRWIHNGPCWDRLLMDAIAQDNTDSAVSQ